MRRTRGGDEDRSICARDRDLKSRPRQVGEGATCSQGCMGLRRDKIASIAGRDESRLAKGLPTDSAHFSAGMALHMVASCAKRMGAGLGVGGGEWRYHCSTLESCWKGI